MQKIISHHALILVLLIALFGLNGCEKHDFTTGTKLRLGALLVPIPHGFVIESVNVWTNTDYDVEELRFFNEDISSDIRAIIVHRRRTLQSSEAFDWSQYRDFGSQASIHNCTHDLYTVLKAEYPESPESQKAVFSSHEFQITLIGEKSPQTLMELLRFTEVESSREDLAEVHELVKDCLIQ